MKKSTAVEAPLVSVFLPQLSAGGAERVLIAIAGEIAKRDYRCDLVTAEAGGRWERRVPEGVRSISLSRKKPLYAVPDLVRYLRRERPVALLSSVFAANVAALLACGLAGTTTRCVLREAYWAEEDAKAASVLARFASRLVLRHLYRRANGIIALTDDLASHIRQAACIEASRLFVIPNPNLPRLPSLAISTAERDHSLIVACGRLEPQKDMATLLRAFSIVRSQGQYRLVVLGEGSQLSMLRDLAAALKIETAVDFLGYCSAPDTWMRQANVFVSTSRIEGFPNVLLEALDNGCRIVSTDSSDAVSDILKCGQLGAIVPVGDPAAVAGAILAAFAADTPMHVENRYDLQGIVDRYLQILTPPHPLKAGSAAQTAGHAFEP